MPQYVIQEVYNVGDENNLHLLDEVYIGKTPRLQMIEKLLDNMRHDKNGNLIKHELISDNEFINGKNTNLNKICRLLEQEFGFESVGILIIANEAINAFAMPLSIRVGLGVFYRFGDNVESSSSGVRFKKSSHVTLFMGITTGLLFNDNFTSGEILAVMLHEIGHNFFVKLSGPNAPVLSEILFSLETLSEIYKYIGNIINSAKNKEIDEESIDKITTNAFANLISVPATIGFSIATKEITKNRVLSLALNFVNYFLYIKNTYKAILSKSDFVKKIFLLLKNKKIRQIYELFSIKRKIKKEYLDIIRPDTLIKAIVTRPQEAYADKFAVMYGYGPELSSWLLKVKHTYRDKQIIYGKLPAIFSHIVKLWYLPVRFAITPISDHGDDMTRSYENLKALEYELEKNNVDPKLVESVRRDIDEIKNVMKDQARIVAEFKNKDLADQIYYTSMLKVNEIANRTGVKKAINKKTFEGYDKAFDKYRTDKE